MVMPSTSRWMRPLNPLGAFPAACGVSPGHDQRLRQEARPGIPEATGELPPGSVLNTPPLAAGILYWRSETNRLAIVKGVRRVTLCCGHMYRQDVPCGPDGMDAPD